MKDDEKDHYLKLAKKEKLAYEIKKREYASKHKKTRTPSSYNLFVSELKGTAPEKFSEEGFFNYAYKKWKVLEEPKKRKYEKDAKKLKDEANREYEEQKSLGKSAPKKALSAYNLFIRDIMPELKKKHPNTEHSEFFGLIAEEYAKISSSEMAKLQKRADKEKQRYEKEKSGYALEMSQMKVSQLEKQEEKKEKEFEGRSKSKITKEINADKSTNKSKSRSKSKSKKATKSEDDSNEQEVEASKVKRTKGKGDKGATKGKKDEDSDESEKEPKTKRGQSKKGKNTKK